MPIIHVMGEQHTELVVRALARHLPARGEEVLALDLAPFRGGLDVVLGMEHLPGWRWPDVVGADGEVDTALLVRRVPRCDHVAVLSHAAGVCDVPDQLVSSLLAASAGLWVLTTVGDPRLVRALGWPAEAVVVAGGCGPREVAALVATVQELGSAQVVLYAAGRGLVEAAECALDQQVAVIGRDKAAETAYERGGPAPLRGPVAGWVARQWPQEAAS